jgi:hypothetical protein
MVRLGNTSITCVTDPQIEMSGGVTYEFPGAGSRDALCALIDKSVTSAVQFATGAVEIHFTEGLVLRVTPWADFPTREFIYIARI